MCYVVNKHIHTYYMGARVETCGRTQDGDRDGNGDGNESSNGDGNGYEDGNGDGNEDGIEERGEAKKRKKSHKSCRRDQALLLRMRHHLCKQRVALRALDSSIRKAWCRYTRIAPRGQPCPRDGKERMGSGARSE